MTLTLRGDESSEAVRRLVEALAADGRKIELRFSSAPAAEVAPAAKAPGGKGGKAAPPAAAAAPTGAEDEPSGVEQAWDNFNDGLGQGVRALPGLAALPQDWARGWAANVNPQAGRHVVLIILAGLAASGIVRLATAGFFRRRLQPQAAYFTARLRASGYGLAQDLLTILVWLIVARGARALLLPEVDLAHHLLSGIVNGSAIGATYVAVARFLLAPGAPERRLMPLPRAERHVRAITLYAVMVPVSIVAALLAYRVASGPEPVAALVAISGLLLCLYKIWWLLDARHDLTALVISGAAGGALSPWRLYLARMLPWIYIAIALLLWAIGRAAASMPDGGRWAEAAELTQIIVALVPILSVGVTSFLACRQARRAEIAAPTPLSRAVGSAMRAAAGGLMWACGFYLVARIWAGLLFAMSMDQFMAFMHRMLGIAALAFAGWVALVFLRSFFDAYTPRRGPVMPGDEDAEPEDSVPSRLATVMPVLRGVVLGAVIGLTVLVLLSRLGVDIGPLLAGFGILGLAVSFGSQALVRDIVSGFFFMIEDAFRVGEYVDTGRLKGTVEKISLRSMQLRHQSGQVHTVPFGQIASLTNASRDWATVKFNVRLDHSADIEQARKTIKKIGAALLEDPEFGPNFIAQLKMQGVADITDQAIVVRLKFTAKPRHASLLQREALKRVYRGLNEAGIPFASNAVTVREGAGRPATGGAAAMASVPPPVPVPQPG
ncbi:mechanosensitive ion channel family protein [Bosea sp. TWI1241]|uniref:mechanosensitive ion channel family protein n=1 Tax=Bosea sp. TWI1241 TaxID=3148904 RepID=UPI00320ABE02